MFRRLLYRFWLLAFGSELESITYPTAMRMRFFGGGMMVFQLLYGYLQLKVWPEQYENTPMRLVMALLGAALFLQTFFKSVPKYGTMVMFALVMWITAPFFFCWLYVMNDFQGVHFSSVIIIAMMFFFLMSWQNALLTLLTALPCAMLLAWVMGKPFAMPPAAHIYSLVFSLAAGVANGITNGTMREQRLRQSLSLMDLVQGTVQKPLARLEALLPRLREAAYYVDQPASVRRMRFMAKRMEKTMLTMRQFISQQRGNAQLLAVGNSEKEPLSARELIYYVVQNYAYATPRIRTCVHVREGKDFYFMGNHAEWVHAFENLLCNAIASLHITRQHMKPGDIVFTVVPEENLGRIVVHDLGNPIDNSVLPHVFEPFFTHGPAAGIGLGLAYCKRVVQSSNGRITVRSSLAGNSFMISVPAVPPPPGVNHVSNLEAMQDELDAQWELVKQEQAT